MPLATRPSGIGGHILTAEVNPVKHRAGEIAAGNLIQHLSEQRAWCYHHSVSGWGDVGLVTNPIITPAGDAYQS